MQRPIVIIVLPFVFGIYFGFLTKIPIYMVLGGGLLFWVICFISLWPCKLETFLPPFLSIFTMIVGMAYYDCRTDSLPIHHIKHILTVHKSLHHIRGIIIEPPIILDENTRNNQLQSRHIVKKSDYKMSFTISAKEIETASGWKKISGIIKVNLYPSKQGVLNTHENIPILHNLIYGQMIELFGYVFLPKPPSNPCEFDYKTYLQRQMPSIHCLMTVINPNNIKIRKSYFYNLIYSFIYTLKNILSNSIYTHTFSNSAPLISSMLLGNRIDLSNEIVDNFMKTGVIHFIAISGFNVGIVVFTVLLPLRFLGIKQTLSTGIILLVVILYAFLTGLNPPVVRASIMVIAFLSSFLVRRQWDITSSIFTAIFFILVRNPSDLFNVGFQLSILATVGIVYGSQKIEGFLFKTALLIEKLQVKAERGRFFFLKKYLRISFCVSLAAWLATLPLTAYYFHLFTPFISITNIVVFPLFWLIIVCGVVLLTLGTICPPLATVSSWLASNTDTVLESLVSSLASLPYSHFYVIGPSQTEIVIYYLFTVILLYRKYFSLDPIRIAIFGLLSANILIFSTIFKYQNRFLTISCLDVGHGSSIIIQFPNRKNILFDAGSWQNYDVGRYIIAPFLWSQNIKKVDLVILSHEHEDHWNGLSSIIERFNITAVYSQPHLFASETGQKILSIIDKRNVHRAALSADEALEGFGSAVVKILNPPLYASPITTTNNNSCVLKIDYLGKSILLCADIQEQGIESILLKPSEIKSDIIQIPHHGSFINNMETLIKAVQPDYAFINSSNSITSHKTLEILQKYNVITLQTHQKGAITFELTKSGILCSNFCQ